MSRLLKALEERVVIGDGAMGTQIYAKGVPLGRCYDELNLSTPHLVRVIHKEYVEAGAELLETNTFTANRVRLRKYELHGRVRDINLAGAKLAREQAGPERFVAGSIGPLTGVKREEGERSADEKTEAFAEQAKALEDGGCDALFLETFTDLEELKLALRAARGATKLPCACLMAFVFKTKTPFGVEPEDALRELEAAGADVIGANCSVPHWTAKVLDRMGASTKARLAAFPNAGLPEYVDGRYMYLTTPEYFAETARKIVNAGANIVGGCCGTGPEHVRAVASVLHAARPMPRRLRPREPVPAEPAPEPATPPAKLTFGDRIGKETLVCVELDPPRGLAYEKALKGAVRLVKAGCDAITVGDSPLAVMRMGNVGMAHLMEREGVPTIVHLSCRDKNLIALQSTILEAAALGITALLPITGDPAKVGDQPQATSVYDLNSFELIRLIANMNEGKGYSGASIQRATRFAIGCAFNPNVKDVDHQVRRLRKKMEAGAHFALSQPVYDIERIPHVYDRVRAGVGGFPVFFGVLPAVSARNAEFLAHEVPGITMPESVIARMKAVPEDRQRAEGLKIAKELIERAAEFAPGFYIIPPFGSVDISVELVEFVKARARR
ncbi:MAG: bifunctional homocysteine S-methyltransferase/methylenetetrahydrofolate reductase [Planctomycetes bacterium]|nr:bifunctional homocysteine S-methyltransferase/methylenetetrahydrofolate reductase [Planctomycetota bacterium]